MEGGTIRRIGIAVLLVAAAAVLPRPADAAVNRVVSPGSFYVPGNDTEQLRLPAAELDAGSDLIYTNLHLMNGHSVTSDLCKAATGETEPAPLPESCPTGYTRAFDSGVISAGDSTAVRGARLLAAGTYGFSCHLHGEMRGVLEVR